MIIRAINCAAMLTLLSGCQSYVYRKADVYEAEVRFLNDASVQGGSTIRSLMSATCKCVDGVWTDDRCAEADQVAFVLDHRVPTHTDMMLYLADIVDKPPADGPSFSSSCTVNK
jgi:hypothetical protein